MKICKINFSGREICNKKLFKTISWGWRDEHNVIMVQLFAHQKKENAQFCSIHTPCKILVPKFSATFIKNKNCTTKFNEHEMWKSPNFEKNLHKKRCLRKVLQALVLNIVFSQFNNGWFVKGCVMFYLLLGIASYVLQKHLGKFIVHIFYILG
jgi:hypothetical protein